MDGPWKVEGWKVNRKIGGEDMEKKKDVWQYLPTMVLCNEVSLSIRLVQLHRQSWKQILIFWYSWAPIYCFIDTHSSLLRDKIVILMKIEKQVLPHNPADSVWVSFLPLTLPYFTLPIISSIGFRERYHHINLESNLHSVIYILFSEGQFKCCTARKGQ